MKISQEGLIPIVLLYMAIVGIIMYILIASVLPLANKRLSLLHPKPISRAANPPIVFKSAEGDILPDNSSGIPLTTSPDVKIELTSTLGPPTPSPIPTSTPSPTPSSSPTPAPTPTPTPEGSPSEAPSPTLTAETPGTTHYKIAESSEELDDASFEPYIEEPTVIEYTFEDTLGSKYIWVEFKDSEGKTDRKAAQIELIQQSTPTPSPTPTPTPAPSPTPEPSATKTPSPSPTAKLSPTPTKKPTPIQTPKPTQPPRVSKTPSSNVNQVTISVPQPRPSVSLENTSEKVKDCGIFCQLGSIITGFNRILERQMEQILLKIGLLK